MSKRWLSPTRTDFSLPSIFDEVGFDKLAKIARTWNARGYCLGCAARPGPEFDRWFLPDERATLSSMGFGIVDASACRVIIETPTQVLIGADFPLWMLPSVTLNPSPGQACQHTPGDLSNQLHASAPPDRQETRHDATDHPSHRDISSNECR
jgi:hypothetical protein